MSVENQTVNSLSFEDLLKDHQRVKIYQGWTSGFTQSFEINLEDYSHGHHG